MRLEGEAYSERLRSFSDSTMMLFAELFRMSKSIADEAIDIVSDSQLNEEEVRAKLIELLNSIDLDSETEN